MEHLRRLVLRLRDDYRGWVQYGKALWAAFQLKRKKKAESKALLIAYRKIGEGSSDSAEAESRHSYGSVKESESLLADRETLVGTRQTELASATAHGEQRMAARAAARESIGAALRESTDNHARTRRALDDLGRELRDVEKQLAGEEVEDRPGLEARQKDLTDRRPDLESAEAEARSVRDGREEELRAEKAAGREEEGELRAKLRDAETALRLSEMERDEARTRLEGSREALGKSIYLSGVAPAAVAPSLDRAKNLMRSIAECEQGMKARRAEAATVRPEATRFTVILGATLILLVLVIGLSVGGSDGPRFDPAVTPAPPPEQETTGGPPPKPSPDRVATGGTLPAETLRRVLALPALQPAEDFKPTGEVWVTRDETAPDGTRRMVVAVPIAAGKETGVAHLRLQIDERGEVIASTLLCIEDRDDRELEKLLEEIE